VKRVFILEWAAAEMGKKRPNRTRENKYKKKMTIIIFRSIEEIHPLRSLRQIYKQLNKKKGKERRENKD